MNGKALIPLVAGLGIGGFALWMGLNTLKSARGAQKPVEKVSVWTAREDIPRGASIAEDMLVSVSFPTGSVPEGAITDLAQIVDRVPRLDAPAGLPVLESMLAPPGTPPGLFVKPGFRAVAVKIDASSGVDYHLEPGSFVDVVGSFTVRRDRQQETLAKTIVENVEVAAVGQRLSPVHNEEDGEKPSHRTVRAVTLFVRPDDVPKLLLAEQKGKIKLSLRNDDDGGRTGSRDPVSDRELTGEQQEEERDERAEVAAAFMEQLRGLFNRPQTRPEQAPEVVVAADPPPAWEVSVYRGDEREVLRFKSRDSRERMPDDQPERPGARRAPPAGPLMTLSRMTVGNPGQTTNTSESSEDSSEETVPKEPQE